MLTIDELTKTIQRFANNGISAVELDEAFLSYLDNNEEYRSKNACTLTQWFEGDLSGLLLPKFPYYYLSAYMKLTDKIDLMERIVRLCVSDGSISKENKLYIYNQIVSYKFFYKRYDNDRVRDLLDELYENIYKKYLNVTTDLTGHIAARDRNEDLIIIFIAQVLGLEHGPTKTLFDRAYILQKKMNKRVFIVNTGDVVPQGNSVPWFAAMGANYVDGYQEVDSVTYKDEQFAFFQCPPEMPDISIIREIMTIVREEKPWFILSLGSANITADLCARIVPTLTVNLGFSELAETRSQFQAVGRALSDSDVKWMRKHSMPMDHYIESLFTFTLKPQTEHLTREQLGIKPDVTVCIVIGGRLFAEIDDDFIRLALRLGHVGIHVAFAGVFDNYDSFAEHYPELRNTTYNLGFQTDILAVCECCDIYVNPRRAGGGTSVVEAMYKGLPALTPNYGDVAKSAGEDFCVDDYDDMYEQIIRLSNDREYYNVMSEKSLNRAKVVMDSETEFTRIINEMTSRESFF